MNFLITFAVFLILSIVSFATSTLFTSENSRLTFIVFGSIFLVVSIITLIAMVFVTMNFRKSQRESINQYYARKKKLTIAENNFEKYKQAVTEDVTKLYPEFEKNIFQMISPTDASALEIYLAKYPELKFKGLLKEYLEKLTEKQTAISQREMYLVENLEEIKNRQDNEWYLFKIKLPGNLPFELI